MDKKGSMTLSANHTDVSAALQARSDKLAGNRECLGVTHAAFHF